MQSPHFNRISLVASLVVLAMTAAWVGSAQQSARAKLDDYAADQVKQLEASYSTNLNYFGRFMTQLALVIGNEEGVNDLFYRARLAYDAAGDGGVGPDAQIIRNQLLAKLDAAWRNAGIDGTARELHFHFPPAVSFLRIHDPSRFGDDMSHFRETVVVANDTRERTHGIEMGTASGGVRGVVPISHTLQDGSVVHVGTLEAGMGLQSMLDLIAGESGAGFSVVVSSDQLPELFVPTELKHWLDQQEHAAGSQIIVSTDPELTRQILVGLGDNGLDVDTWSVIREFSFGAFALARIPLRDFAGQRDPGRPSLGTVLAWVPINDALLDYKRRVAEAIVFGIFGAAFLLAVLFFALGQEQKLVLERKASVTDALTGLSNRRHFDEVLNAEIRRAARSGHSVAVILTDVDFFKRYNDHYGHQAGDECLRLVAQTMLGELQRAGDFIARYGGEEFVIVLPDSSLSAGMAVAEKLRRAVESQNIIHELHPGKQKVTVSLGVAAGRVAQDESKALVAMADDALYRAKGFGRNNTQGLRFGDEQIEKASPLLYR